MIFFNNVLAQFINFGATNSKKTCWVSFVVKDHNLKMYSAVLNSPSGSRQICYNVGGCEHEDVIVSIDVLPFKDVIKSCKEKFFSFNPDTGAIYFNDQFQYVVTDMKHSFVALDNLSGFEPEVVFDSQELKRKVEIGLSHCEHPGNFKKECLAFDCRDIGTTLFATDAKRLVTQKFTNTIFKTPGLYMINCIGLDELIDYSGDSKTELRIRQGLNKDMRIDSNDFAFVNGKFEYNVHSTTVNGFPYQSIIEKFDCIMKVSLSLKEFLTALKVAKPLCNRTYKKAPKIGILLTAKGSYFIEIKGDDLKMEIGNKVLIPGMNECGYLIGNEGFVINVNYDFIKDMFCGLKSGQFTLEISGDVRISSFMLRIDSLGTYLMTCAIESGAKINLPENFN